MSEAVAKQSRPSGSSGTTPALGRKAASGFAWGIFITIVGKACTMLTNLVLTYLLLPEDLGLVGLAYTVSTFAFTVQCGGLQQVLIQRHEKLNRWANPACLLSITQGLLAALIMIIGGRIAAAMYHQPQVMGLLLVLSLVPIINSHSIIPLVRLSSQLRFREMAVTNSFAALLSMVLSIVAACLGCGAYSFVISVPFSSLFVLLVYVRLSKTPWPRWRLDLPRWGSLIKDGGLILAGYLCSTAILQGDYIILGWIEGRRLEAKEARDVVGLYFFAFMLSMQIISVLSSNLHNVLFPTLSKIQHDPPRQRNAFLKATRAMALIMIPSALLLSVTVDSIIRVFFAAKWAPAIPLAQVLSFGMALRTVSWASGTLLLAQGRFKTTLLWYAATAPVFLLVVFLGVYFGDSRGAAVAEALYFTCIDPWFIYVAIRPSGGRVIELWYTLRLPLLTGLLVAGVAWAVGTILPPDLPQRDLLRLVVMGIVSGIVYLGVLRWAAAAEFQQVWGRLRSLRLRR